MMLNNQITSEIYLSYIIADKLNAYEYLRITDCARTQDYFIKKTDDIELLLSNISCKILFDIILKLNSNGLKNLVNHFSRVFDRLETEHLANVKLNVWDVRTLKEIVTKKYNEIKFVL